MERTRKLLNAFFALIIAAGLGFGANQAVAADAPAEARACTQFSCHRDCVMDGYNYGICEDGVCECWYF